MIMEKIGMPGQGYGGGGGGGGPSSGYGGSWGGQYPAPSTGGYQPEPGNFKRISVNQIDNEIIERLT